MTRIQIELPNGQQQKDAERTGVPATLQGSGLQGSITLQDVVAGNSNNTASNGIFRDRGADGINLDFEPLASTYSDEFVALIKTMRSELTSEIEFGESSTFSGSAPRVPVVVTGFSSVALNCIATSSVVAWPAVTLTPSMRRNA